MSWVEEISAQIARRNFQCVFRFKAMKIVLFITSLSLLSFISSSLVISEPYTYGIEDSSNATQKDSFLIYNGDTINRVNEKGYQYGLWYKFPDSSSAFTFHYYRTGETGQFSDNLWTKSFYPSGIIRSYWSRDTLLQYDENGRLASQQISIGYQSSICDYFYPSGQVERTCYYTLKSRYVDGSSISEIGPTLDSCHCWSEIGEIVRNCP